MIALQHSMHGISPFISSQPLQGAGMFRSSLLNIRISIGTIFLNGEPGHFTWMGIKSIRYIFSPPPRPGRGIFMFRGRGLSGIGVGFLRRIFPGGDQVVGVLHQLLLAFIVQLGDRFRQGLKNGGGGGNGRNGARRNNIP